MTPMRPRPVYEIGSQDATITKDGGESFAWTCCATIFTPRLEPFHIFDRKPLDRVVCWVTFHPRIYRRSVTMAPPTGWQKTLPWLSAMRRCARAAISGSWVTITIVWPCR